MLECTSPCSLARDQSLNLCFDEYEKPGRWAGLVAWRFFGASIADLYGCVADESAPRVIGRSPLPIAAAGIAGAIAVVRGSGRPRESTEREASDRTGDRRPDPISSVPPMTMPPVAVPSAGIRPTRIRPPGAWPAAVPSTSGSPSRSTARPKSGILRLRRRRCSRERQGRDRAERVHPRRPIHLELLD